MISPQSVLAANWRQISGLLFPPNESYVFLHMQNSSAILILLACGACTPTKKKLPHALWAGQEETLPRLISLGRVCPDRSQSFKKRLLGCSLCIARGQLKLIRQLRRFLGIDLRSCWPSSPLDLADFVRKAQRHPFDFRFAPKIFVGFVDRA